MTESLTPKLTLTEIDGGSGREMLPSVKGAFRRLEEGKDYSFLAVDPLVKSPHPIQQYMVFTDSIGGEIELPVHAPHWRTITQPIDATFRIAEDETEYYAANTKGVGYLKPLAKGYRVEQFDSWIKDDSDDAQEHLFGAKVLGLLHEIKPQLIDTTAHLTKAGLRTELIWGVAELKNVMYQGALTSVDELKAKKVIINRRDYTPLMAVRLMRTNDRVAECSKGYGNRPNDVLAHAFETANRENRAAGNKELSIDNPDDRLQFLKDFSSRMGSNIAVLLNEGYAHFWLHSANVTMAAEIVDMETLFHWKSAKNPSAVDRHNGVRRASLKDMRDMAYCIQLMTDVLHVPGQKAREAAFESCLKGYRDASLPAQQELQKTDSQNATAWMSSILRAVLIDKKRLAPLNKNEVSDWNISL